MTVSKGFYRKYLLLTVTTVCLLILAGGIVRSTGSGMGCPDWPRCFGAWIPPTSADQLPDNYQEVYSLKRQTKNLKLASYLETLGFNELSYKLSNDPSILEEEEFNASKTWIEYINRLLGAVVGILFLINVWLAYRLEGLGKRPLVLSLINLILVGFQGWVGSIVVSTNLLGGMITFHMLLALLILAILIYNYWLLMEGLEQEEIKGLNSIYRVLWVAMILFVVQVALGTQVREAIDVMAKQLGEARRSLWIDGIGLTFLIHRSYSIIILGLHGYFVFQGLKLIRNERLRWAMKGLIVLMLTEIATGAIMAYFAIPAIMQPIHLVLATLIFGLDIYLLLEVRRMRQFSLSRTN